MKKFFVLLFFVPFVCLGQYTPMNDPSSSAAFIALSNQVMVIQGSTNYWNTISVISNIAAYASNSVITLNGQTNSYSYLLKSQTFTGDNTFTNGLYSLLTPTVGTQVVNKTYADGLVTALNGQTNSYLYRDGSRSMQGTLDLGGNNITNVDQIYGSASMGSFRLNVDSTLRDHLGNTAMEWGATPSRTLNNSWSAAVLDFAQAYCNFLGSPVTNLSGIFFTDTTFQSTAANVWKGSNQTWTGNNTFTNGLYSLLTPTVGTQVVNKTYADGLVTALNGQTNSYLYADGHISWTGNQNAGVFSVTNLRTIGFSLTDGVTNFTQRPVRLYGTAFVESVWVTNLVPMITRTNLIAQE